MKKKKIDVTDYKVGHSFLKTKQSMMMGNVLIIGKKKGMERKEKKGRKERGRLHTTSENPQCLLELLEMCALWLMGGVFQAEVFAA